MLKPVQTCTNCGAGLTLDDMRKDNCPYCHVVYPHKSQQAQHANMANQMMGQMMAQQAQVQAQWRGAFGVGTPPPTGQPGMPPTGQPGMPPGMTPGAPYNPNAMIQHHMAQANATASGIQKMVLIFVIGTFVMVGGIMLLVALL
jgi:hypothetical protein